MRLQRHLASVLQLNRQSRRAAFNDLNTHRLKLVSALSAASRKINKDQPFLRLYLVLSVVELKNYFKHFVVIKFF